MVVKIILAVSLVGFLSFEVFNLVSAIKRRRAAKRQRIADQPPADDKKSDKEVND